MQDYKKALIIINRTQIIRILIFIVLGLTFLSLIGNFANYLLGDNEIVSRLRLLVDVDSEMNIPTWWSSIALLMCSVLLAIIAILKKGSSSRFTRHWAVLSGIFLYLSMDEAALIHEMAIKPIQRILDVGGFLYFAWVIPASIFLLIFVIAYLQFLFYLPKKTRLLFILAGTIFVGGSLFLEMLSAYVASSYGGDYASYSNSIEYILIAASEELFEMVGILIFLYSLMSYLSRYLKGTAISIKFSD